MTEYFIIIMTLLMMLPSPSLTVTISALCDFAMLTPLERLLWASEGNANVIASDSLAFEDARYSFAALEVIISFCHL